MHHMSNMHKKVPLKYFINDFMVLNVLKSRIKITNTQSNKLI